MTAPLDLAALEALAKAASPEAPGPWVIDWMADEYGVDSIKDADGHDVVIADSGVYPPHGNVAAHIAAFSPPVALALIAAARAGEALRAKVGAYFATLDYAGADMFDDDRAPMLIAAEAALRLAVKS